MTEITIPERLTLQLLPKEIHISEELTKNNYNPLLQLTFSSKKSIGKIVEYVYSKWVKHGTNGPLAPSPIRFYPTNEVSTGWGVESTVSAGAIYVKLGCPKMMQLWYSWLPQTPAASSSITSCVGSNSSSLESKVFKVEPPDDSIRKICDETSKWIPSISAIPVTNVKPKGVVEARRFSSFSNFLSVDEVDQDSPQTRDVFSTLGFNPNNTTSTSTSACSSTASSPQPEIERFKQFDQVSMDVLYWRQQQAQLIAQQQQVQQQLSQAQQRLIVADRFGGIIDHQPNYLPSSSASNPNNNLRRKRNFDDYSVGNNNNNNNNNSSSMSGLSGFPRDLRMQPQPLLLQDDMNKKQKVLEMMSIGQFDSLDSLMASGNDSLSDLVPVNDPTLNMLSLIHI
eukprot:TRINITY_DN3912_c0_g1_i1.p1 TRINITY_DN3912_c0_g1~~TRINITY_DN3912_c0_g1_i1.p1  ORF type:complete len:431 (-),score=106.10 TRINITY_DN3912_c0_g1_i1:21-1208(-)